MLNIYLIRHGESEANVNHHFIGGQDIKTKLTTNGAHQADQLGYYLREKGMQCDQAFSSDTVRTRTTAAHVLDYLDYKGWVILEQELIEHDTGDWEGKPHTLYNRPDVARAIKEDKWNFTPGDIRKGESMADVAVRMRKVIERMIDCYADYPCIQNVFVFSHGMAIRCLLIDLFQLDKSSEIAIDNTSVTVIRFHDGLLIDPFCYYEGQEGEVVIGENGNWYISDDLWNNTEHLK